MKFKFTLDFYPTLFLYQHLIDTSFYLAFYIEEELLSFQLINDLKRSVNILPVMSLLILVQIMLFYLCFVLKMV